MRSTSGKLGIALALAMVLGAAALAQEIQFFRIGTGGTAGTYYPVGGLIANAISNPPGSLACDKGGSCGVPGLVAMVQSSGGSIENVEGIGEGRLELALSQADIAYWAYHGTGLFRDRGAIANLRAIANLYPESLHVVVRRGAGIASIAGIVRIVRTFGFGQLLFTQYGVGRKPPGDLFLQVGLAGLIHLGYRVQLVLILVFNGDRAAKFCLKYLSGAPGHLRSRGFQFF